LITTLVPLTGVVRDPHDDTVIATAQRAQAAYTVIRDNDLLSLSSTKTSANRGDEFLEAALIADKDGKSAVLFDPQVVQKRGEHFRDQRSPRRCQFVPIFHSAADALQGRLSRCTFRHKSPPLSHLNFAYLRRRAMREMSLTVITCTSISAIS
jgi:hypothetical protein